MTLEEFVEIAQRQLDEERDVLERIAIQWQDWTRLDYKMIDEYRQFECFTPDDIIRVQVEQVGDSAQARKFLFKLIEMGKVE
ncbi:hypothetical protein P106B_95 [Rhizobium phage vB_RglS_P106B]|uniref:Uncharacterized protein n=1 Tax=Rhizobium phage vB_RglS_P106B TaxID=1458697 RepID=W6E9V0_9CAUD|nr:hypothetical protein P106B_95 [Rhizobium phage vB_RglS_P106B]AHJ10778.1 hypothetical protein P106B_95 [Rhizobium phage vB_RglS_P106B]